MVLSICAFLLYFFIFYRVRTPRSQLARRHFSALLCLAVVLPMGDDMHLLTDDAGSWVNANLVSVSQLTPGGLKLLCQVAEEMKELVRKEGGDDRLKHKLMANVFLEASTRTSCSFQSAMMRLGGRVSESGSVAAVTKQRHSLVVRPLRRRRR